jgi:PIN domain nuclease of toxin-antitoxin system
MKLLLDTDIWLWYLLGNLKKQEEEREDFINDLIHEDRKCL